MRNNPFAGPAHVVALANSLERERRPGAYARPPVTGGNQISVRLGEALLTHLDIIGKASGWTRVQVLTALIERGLFDLYDLLSDEVGESIMDSLTNELVPTMHGESSLLRAAKGIAREVVGDSCTLSPGTRPEQFWVEGLRQSKGIPRMRIAIDSHAAGDFQNATPSQRERMVEQLRGRIEEKWRVAMEQLGTEPLLSVDPQTLQ